MKAYLQIVTQCSHKIHSTRVATAGSEPEGRPPEDVIKYTACFQNIIILLLLLVFFTGSIIVYASFAQQLSSR